MDVKEKLDLLTPETERLPHWDAVLRDARPSRARWAAPRLAIVGAVVALAALVAVAPWRESEPTGILDRALAAVGDGEVLHVVFRGEWGGTVVDLETGKRTPAYGEREVWYDPKRDLVHQVSRLGGVVEHDSLYERNPKDEELTALWQQYRGALEGGTARVVGQDVIDGVPVHWIIVRSQMLPDVADNKDHEWAQQVAVSQETYKPVAMRYTRDRKAPEGVTERILRYETVWSKRPTSRSRKSRRSTAWPSAKDASRSSSRRQPMSLAARRTGSGSATQECRSHRFPASRWQPAHEPSACFAGKRLRKRSAAWTYFMHERAPEGPPEGRRFAVLCVTRSKLAAAT
jgi:hypothetical protein